MNYLQILQRHKPFSSAVIVFLILLSGCSESVEESPADQAAYQAACHGAPLGSVEQRQKALEDGYSINQRYDCIDKGSFAAHERQLAEWNAAHTPEAIAQQEAEFAARRERELAIMSGGQPLWDRALDRMTVQEVRKAFPKAKDNPRREQDTYDDGSKSLLILSGVKMAGLEFIASFVFLNEKLILVSLSTNGPGKQIEKAHMHLVESFQAKYGVAHEDKRITSLHSSWDEEWMNNATQILLWTSIYKTPDDKQYGSGDIKINYRVRPEFFDSSLKK